MIQPIVSDHALIRWLERAHGFDFTRSRAKIADIVREAVAVAATAVRKDGLKYCIVGQTVTTIKPYSGKRTPGRSGKRPTPAMAKLLRESAE